MTLPLSSRQMVALAVAGSAGLLIGALIFQSLGFAPCELCILQRWPHLAAALIGAAYLALRLPAVTLIAGALAAAATSALGVYHSGVERHIFEGPTSCTSNGVTGLNATDLLAQIQTAPLVRCDEIVWDIFGITMPNLNAVFSAGLVVWWLIAFAKARRGA
ncbi:disulfide bond formation protein B [Rhodobacter xanthinilyticus]|uniref:Disulfide bond formation protein B n=1 Tax=Rhodobacter xanthinilyticus TaxID=1850250 RepID=A0A1D9MCT6_9RHOB|nr:disulfide bond formation protein B [Rhodobacter xanthinilyticus]AOZ69608.1 disulfide bond formation protein B [Rhodobacter xanthinilyticus]